MPQNYYINVGDQATTSVTQQDFNTPSITETEISNKQRGQFGAIVATAGLTIAKKAFNDYTSRIGQRTGNRQQQANINNALRVANVGFTLAQGFAGGFAVGGGVGGLVGLGVAGAMTVYSEVVAYQDQQRDINENTLNAEMTRKMVIFNNSNNRMRGNE